MASSPSPSPSRGTPTHDTATAVVITSQCSFATREVFQTTERALRNSQYESSIHSIRRTPTKFQPPSPTSFTPVFVTSVQSPSQFALKTDAAKRNDHAKTPYEPPSAFQHRLASPPQTWTRSGDDFVAKFHLASNQDLRSRAALDQEGLFSPTTDEHRGVAATQLVASDHPDAHRPRTTASSVSRPAFQSSVPHTTRKSASVALRIETLVDQQGLLPQLHEIRSHQFRDEHAPASASPTRSPSSTRLSASVSASSPFRTAFKPAPPLRPIGDS